MKELIKIETINVGGEEINAVDARMLHEFLESRKDFSSWFKAKVFDNVFFNFGTDWVNNKEPESRAQGLPQSGEAQPCTSQPLSANRKDYTLSIYAAKQVAMAEQTPRGFAVRNYFIRVEKEYKALALPQTYIEALRQLADTEEQKQLALVKVEKQKQKIEEDKPKVELIDAIAATNGSIDVGDFANALGIKDLGRNNLYRWFRMCGYLQNGNKPYRKYIEAGYFDVIEIPVNKTNFKSISFKTLVTTKGQIYFTKRIKGSI